MSRSGARIVALGGDAVRQPAVALQRVRPPVGLEPADQHGVVGLQEQDPGPQPRVAPARRSRRSGRWRTPGCGRPCTTASRVTAPWLRLPRSTMVATSSGGRLSTTKKPRSSRHLAAVLRPAPDSPVTITVSRAPRSALAIVSSLVSNSPVYLRLPVAQAVVGSEPSRSARRAVDTGRCGPACRLLQHLTGAMLTAVPARRAGRQRVGDPAGQSGPTPGTAAISSTPACRSCFSEPNCFSSALRRAGPGRRRRQRGLGHRLRPLLPVEGDGEPVRLVAHPLQQVQRLGGARQDHRVVLAGHPDLLQPLGQSASVTSVMPEFGEHRLRPPPPAARRRRPPPACGG